MNKNRPCPPDFIGENHVPSRYPAPPGAPKPKFLDALDKTEADSAYSLPVKRTLRQVYYIQSLSEMKFLKLLITKQKLEDKL